MSAFVAPVLLALSVLMAAGPALAQTGAAACGSLQNGSNGPFDYRVDRDKLKIVEDFHFTPQVEALVSGQSSVISGDLDYTLRAFPNHHRALIAMSRLGLRHKSLTAPQAPRSVECYFDRALRFRPDDTVARMLYATYLRDIKRLPDALKQVDQAIEIGKDNAFTQYNAGLVLADMGEFERALQQAHKAEAMGFMRKELREKLQAAGKWAAPSGAGGPQAAAATAPAPPASAASGS